VFAVKPAARDINTLTTVSERSGDRLAVDKRMIIQIQCHFREERRAHGTLSCTKKKTEPCACKRVPAPSNNSHFDVFTSPSKTTPVFKGVCSRSCSPSEMRRGIITGEEARA